MIIIFIKILLIFLLAYGSVDLYICEKYVLMCFCLIPLIILMYSITFGNNTKYPVVICEPSNYLDNKKLNEEISKKCTINKNVINMENTITDIVPQLPPIKTLVELDLNKKQENIIIDATKGNKPTIDINKTLIPKISSTIKSCAKEAILIDNSRQLDKEKEIIYNAIISILNEQQMLSDKKYALLQSFMYIDNTKDAIVIYIDYDILYKAKLTTVHLKQFDIISEIRKKINKPNFRIIFAEYKTKSLLNYFLDKKK